jgi:hypothetical protein
MMLIDVTNELAPMLVGLNVALVVSALAIVSNAASSWLQSVWRTARPRFAMHRPVLAR